MTQSWATVHQLVGTRADRSPQSVAVTAPGRRSLTFAGLRDVVNTAAATLRGHGIRRNDVVGTLLPNGPEAATAFLAVASAATVAPLNPAYTESELDFYLTDLAMSALIVRPDFESPAADVARSRGIPVINLTSQDDEPAGALDLEGAEAGFADPAAADDVALVLHTSGTTSRPKMVPLRHRNLVASAEHIASTLLLTPQDRCLNVMPLFHIHGLMAAVLASLSAGASVVCTQGFVSTEFFAWVEECRPSWYTAVPTMHQAILQRAPDARDIIEASPLRFARSSSASLAPRVMSGLEAALGVPVVEAYGMTEAAHQMTSNPLPPAIRKPGSVGPPAGPDVAIMSSTGELVSQETEGEIVIRGPNVMDGYTANPDANRDAFVAGWFRTGDLGTIDEDGHIFISGRIKEIINRGGESISPREIDETLLDHPAVAQAVTFAVADTRLGEQVAAAVVLVPNGLAPSERDLRHFVSMKLAPFKVPRRVLFLTELPKGPSGKLQRIGLAERLGLRELDEDGETLPHTAPETAVERWVGELWEGVLHQPGLSVHDRFLDVGGDSLLAMQLLSRVREALGFELTMIDFFDRPTIAQQAALIEDMLLAGNTADGR